MSGDGAHGVIEALAANALNTRFEDLGQATVDHAKNRIIDVLGCAIGGANAVGNAALLELVRDWGGKEEASILVWGGRVPACNAAMVNSIMARSLDFEPVNAMVHGVSVPAHISGTTVMTATTLGEMKRSTGKEVITAMLVGDDIAARVLGASGYGLTLGWDCTGTVNMIGATAIAGRLLGLSERQMVNALGIAMNQLAGSFQIIWDATTAFKLPQGLSARNGVFSAQLAKAGWTGPRDPLLGKFGYYDLYTGGCTDQNILTDSLGEEYCADSTFKPYPCCRGGHAVIDCALSLLARADVKADDIDEIVLYVPKRDIGAFIGQPFTIGDFPHGSAAFNFRYLVACAIVRGGVKPEHFSEESIRDPKISSVAERITLAELEDEQRLSARLALTTKSGATLVEAVDVPTGDPRVKPLTRGDVVDKFRANVEFSGTVARDDSERALDLLEQLEELDNVDKIIELLTVQWLAPVSNASSESCLLGGGDTGARAAV